MKIKTISNNCALALVRESISNGIKVRLKVKGSSMWPTFRDGHDIVTLRRYYEQELQEGVIILFESKEEFIIHRIVAIDRDKREVIAKGDANKFTEVVSFNRIIAIAEINRRWFSFNGLLRFLRK